MSSRSACALLFALFCAPLYPQDWESFAAASNRSTDPVILQTMETGTLEVNIALCRGVARRGDEDMRSIIDRLASRYAPGTSLNTELLLRYLLDSALQARSAGARQESWAAANADSLAGLLAGITRWKSAQLKGTLLRLAVIAPDLLGTKAIVEVGAAVVDELQASRSGLIPSEDAALALDFLEAARQTVRQDLLPYCTAIARLSRDRVLVAAARSTAAALIGAP